MLEREDKNIYEEITVLQDLFLSSGEKLRGLKESLGHRRSDLEKLSARRKSAVREAFVSEKRLKDMQNEISSLRLKISLMDDSLNAIDEASKMTDAQLNSAILEKDHIEKERAKIESDVQQTENAIALMEPQRQEVLTALEKIETEKNKLSEEISELLSKTSIEKEEIDADLKDLALEFERQIGERDRTKALLAQREEAVGGLKDAVQSLEERCRLIEETMELEKTIGDLKTHIEHLEEEGRTNSRKVETLQSALHDKEKELDALSSGNVEMKDAIEALEKEVGPYDDLLSKGQKSENEFTESVTLIEEGVSDLRDLFSRHNRMLGKL